MSVRAKLLRIYWKMEKAIVPGLPSAGDMYEQALEARLAPQHRWVDLGCGHQVFAPWRVDAEKSLIGRCRLVVGIDPDLGALRTHQSIRVRVAGDIGRLPFADQSFDVASANMVVEHLASPGLQFREIGRILKPGGWFVFHTPNVHGYATLLARMIPERAKPRLIHWLEGRKASDVFPAFYRANSDAAVRRWAEEAGFETVEISMAFSAAQFALVPPLAFLELIVMRGLMWEALRGLRGNMVAVLRKRGPTANLR